MPQPAIWRRQSANKLKDLLVEAFLPSDYLVDDLIRSLSSLPKRPVEQVPYQEIFGVDTLKSGREYAGEKLRILLVNMQDGFNSNDGLVDDLIRTLSGLPNRPTDQTPYQEIFAETNVNLVSEEQLLAIAPDADPSRIIELTIPLNLAMVEFNINTPLRQAHFLTQLVHESGSFQYLEELGGGEDYEGRDDLGNTELGDGVRFKGRGFFQVTGRYYYQQESEALGVDLVHNPERLADFDLASRSAAMFWNQRQLNEYADMDDLRNIRMRINGGFNSLDGEWSTLKRAKTAIDKTATKDDIILSVSGNVRVTSGSINVIGYEEVTFVSFINHKIETTRANAGEILDDLVHSPQNLTRYPNLDCPDKTILNQRFSLTVELLLDKPEDQPESASVTIEDTGTDKLPEVEVVLSHSGFDLEGSNTEIMEVERDDDSSVRFVLIPRKLGQHKIKVQFYQNGKPIGKSVRNVLVSEQSVTVEVPQPDQPNGIELQTNLTISPQDLELFIELDDDGRTLSFFLHSVKEEVGYRRTKVGKTTLQGSPLEKMQTVYKKMNKYANTKPTNKEDEVLAKKRIADIGSDLWQDLIPDKLKQEYWKFKSRVKSIMINSDEPWIPWELLKPYRENEDGEQENDLFWCQQFTVSRWLSAGATLGEFDIKRTRPVAPRQENLPFLKEEIAFLEQLSSLQPNINSLSAFNTPTQVLESLKNEDLSILHFACHGLFDSTSPNDSAIRLSDGLLYAADIRGRFGGKRQRPLIFINACHGGRAEFSFTGLGGWAERLINAGAGAFIGAMWEVSDELALHFTKAFYTALLKDKKTISESFRQAREEIRQKAPYNSTWLAYTLYADPEGRVKSSAKIVN